MAVLTVVDQSLGASVSSAAVSLHSPWTCHPWAAPRCSKWRFVHRRTTGSAGRLPLCAVCEASKGNGGEGGYLTQLAAIRSATYVHFAKARQPELVLQLLAVTARKAAHVRQERGN